MGNIWATFLLAVCKQVPNPVKRSVCTTSGENESGRPAFSEAGYGDVGVACVGLFGYLF